MLRVSIKLTIECCKIFSQTLSNDLVWSFFSSVDDNERADNELLCSGLRILFDSGRGTY